MPYQVDDALLHAMSGTELSRVRTELRLLPEPNNQRLLLDPSKLWLLDDHRLGRKEPNSMSRRRPMHPVGDRPTRVKVRAL